METNLEVDERAARRAGSLLQPLSVATELEGRHGRYRLGGTLLGVGAQAEVWAGERADGLAVAVKVAHASDAARDALEAEGKWLELLAERGVGCVVPCIDHVRVHGRPALVLPRLPGDIDAAVRGRVEADPGRGLEAILSFSVRLACALEALHGADPGRPEAGRLVHRDVKPENVLVDATGAIRLADLGGSLLTDGRAAGDLGVFGSLRWAPPDQMLPGAPQPGPHWDTYAACVMVFTWIAGGPPSFQADPRSRLTDRGRDLHARLRDLARTAGDERAQASEALFHARSGLRARDVVDPEASPRLPFEDRERLAAGVARLVDPGAYGPGAAEEALQALLHILERGLSPHATPSPPHRYESAAELARALLGVGRRLGASRRGRSIPGAERATAPRETPARSGRWKAILPALGAGAILATRVEMLERAPEAGGVPLVWVGAGDGPPGTDDGWVPAFRIARAEVSNLAWQTCVQAGACSPPAWAVRGSSFELGVGRDGDAFRLLGGDRQPVVGVTAGQAEEWCAWAGGRLPTDAEWTRAALSGPDGRWRAYPWGGGAPDCSRANVGVCGLGLTVATEGFTPGASAWGAVQMFGNAWEWTATSEAGERVLRGGAFDTSAGEISAGARRRDRPGTVAADYGFRCVWPE